ncbi:unnamed protein product [Chironomus riparius]|uniref:Probable ATP-dependent RNA helicase spindle-E n=1 Tax=Chironomus riparius TaxID=315576 RepID=A0A9N9S1L1_9DIPT|nr:unnamed protein product [Chironomus riparius]
MESSDEDDIIDAFFRGEMPKKHKIQPKPNLTIVKNVSAKDEEINFKREVIDDLTSNRIATERKILTEFLNTPVEEIDDTLGIAETEEIQDGKPEHKKIYKKYEFDIPRQKLPIDSKHNQILQTIKTNKITILKADTGVGKSSQVPQYILEDCQKRNIPCNIVITQPKKISAESLATRVAFERKCEVGSLVGYQVGLDKKINAEDTRILYCTTGVFLQKLVHYKSLQKWTHIVIDEIHERDLDMDMVLLIIRRLMVATNSKTKIILMSATLNCDKIADYFQILHRPPVINLNVPKPFPVKIHYLDELEHLGNVKENIDLDDAGIDRNVMRLGADIIDFFCQKGADSFLVFLPGIYEIECFHRELSIKREKFDIRDYQVFILHSSIPLTNFKSLYDTSLKNKVILATNIAESSITIPGIRIIIDFCLTKYLEVDSASSLTQLKLAWASKMNCEQRAGRTGRTSFGQVIRMMYKEQYEQLPNETKAEMQRTSLENVILKIKKLEMGKPTDILAIALDPPTRTGIIDAILMLKENGALTRFNKRQKEFDFLDGNLTFTGAIMSKLPMDIRLSKLVVLGYAFSVLNECIIIAAGLSVGTIFIHDSSMNSYETKLNHDSTSDLIAILNAYYKYTEWIRNNNNEIKPHIQEEWCKRQMISYKNIKEMMKQITDIKHRLHQFNIINDNFRYTTEEKLIAIKFCIAGAFYPNFYTFGGDIPGREEFKHVFNKSLLSTVYFQTKMSTKNGHLYEEQLRELLYKNEITNCADDASVTFDSNSQKVYVEFNNLRNDCEVKMPGEVKLEVYRGLKYRSLKHNNDMILYMMSPENEEIYSPSEEVIDLYNESSVGHDLKLKAKFSIFPNLSIKLSDKGQYLWGDITHIQSPSRFYFQPKKAINSIDKMKKVIGTNLKSITDFDGLDEIIDNKIMVFNESIYKRGKIVEYPKENEIVFKVLLIDYGNIIDCTVYSFFTGIAVKIDQRQDIIRSFFKLPPLCYECKLAEIQPTATQQYGWSKKAIDGFKELINNKIIQLDLYSFNAYDKVAYVQVYAKSNPTSAPINVNSKLVHKGLAVYSNESYVAMISKTLNDNSQGMKFAIHKETKDVKYPERLLDIECDLLGPFTPLESTKRLEKIHRAPERDIVVDHSSINSVLLDPYPHNGIKKVLVASSKSKSNRGVINLKQTTIMPQMIGMTSILTLIFSPYAEIRHNKEKTRYTSILAGLGCDFNGKSYYGEHDCMVRTDVEIDNEDITWINNLRKELSLLMQQNLTEHYEYQLNPVNVINESRTRACSLLLKIIKKERLQLGQVYADNFDWTELTKREICEHLKMFASLKPFKLNEIPRESVKRMINHFKNLEQKEKYNSKHEEIECLACDERIETIIDLKNHLLTIKHTELKAKYEALDRDSGNSFRSRH